MTRKRYKKLMMSIGHKRNDFDKVVTYEICGEVFSTHKYMTDREIFTSYDDLWDWYSQYFTSIKDMVALSDTISRTAFGTEKLATSETS